jgi:Xaa-Pro aminopeptidase
MISALAADLQRRARAAQALMLADGLRALVTMSTGAPSQTGWLRYLTAAELLDGQAFVVLEAGRPDPLVIAAKPEHLVWPDGAEACSRVTAARDPVAKLGEVLSDLTGGRGRIGTAGMTGQLEMPADEALRQRVPALERVDITQRMNGLRQVKSAFELDAMREAGRIQSDGLALFESRARPGVNASALAGEIEGFLRGRGCYWGTSKYSLDLQPFLFPAVPDRFFTQDDIPVFEFVYSGPLGYWYILSSLYSFAPLPARVERCLRATEDAIAEMARVAVPGATRRDIGEASDRTFASHGLEVAGRHTVDLHPIGTDINDGPVDPPLDWPVTENMTLAIHPPSLADGGIGFFLCDIFVVKPGGAEPLSPRRSFYRRLT